MIGYQLLLCGAFLIVQSGSERLSGDVAAEIFSNERHTAITKRVSQIRMKRDDGVAELTVTWSL